MRSVKVLLAKLQASETPAKAVENFKLAEIQILIDKSAQLYYRTDDHVALMTDECYDALIAGLRKLEPKDERLTRVGIPYSVEELRNKIDHPIPMGSLDNTDGGISGYPKWFNDILIKLGSTSAAVCASLKIDGGSLRLRYVKGRLIEAATRGNGEVGENITANAANFQGVPTVLSQEIDLDVRGEAVLYIADYENIRSRDLGMPFADIPEKERSNPRNIGNGMLGRDSGQDADKLQFIAFNCEMEAGAKRFTTEQEKFEFLRNLGFQAVPHRVCETTEDVEQFYATTATQRDQLPFEIDGVVVVMNSLDYQDAFITDDIKSRLRPKFTRAIKFGVKTAITIIKDVELSIGHSGAIVPTAVLEEVRIGGVNVSHALLNNWDEIKRLDIAIGDRVVVGLAGDIIPKILARVPTEQKYKCPKCGFKGTKEEQEIHHSR